LIDFIKIYVFEKGVIDHITNLEFIHKVNYSQWVNFDTGQIFITHMFNLDGILFYWDDYKLTIVIKPHYYYNENKHNANDFTTSNCIETLKGIIKRLELKNVLEHLKIVGIEYGVNFVINVKDTEVMNSLYYHSTNLFYNIKDLPYCKVSYKPRPNGKANQHKQYKFYSKAIQHPTHCAPNTLRAEIRSNRSAFIKTLGINTLDDLLNISNYNVLRFNLQKETEQLLFIQDFGNLSKLTRKQKRKIKQMSHPIYWQKTLKNNRSKFALKKQQYFNILNRTNQNLTKLVVTSVTDKLNELFSSKSGLTSSTPISKKSGLTSTYSIGRPLPTFKKLCLVTGINISMQKPSSKFLSNTGLKYLELHDLPTFLKLKGSLLTGNVNRFEKGSYNMMSKQIRNRYACIKPLDPNQMGISF